MLAWVSLGWMCAEGAIGLWQGFLVGSIALIGWALGSAVEGLASVVVVWRFTGERTLSYTHDEGVIGVPAAVPSRTAIPMTEAGHGTSPSTATATSKPPGSLIVVVGVPLARRPSWPTGGDPGPILPNLDGCP